MALQSALQLLLWCGLTQSLDLPITADVKKSSVWLTYLAGQTMPHAKLDGKEIKGIINNKVYEAYQPNSSNSYWMG